MVRKSNRDQQPTVRFRQFWGESKRTDLLKSLHIQDFNSQYQLVDTNRSKRFSFRPLAVAENYLNWPNFTEFSMIPPSRGLLENRKEALVGIDSHVLSERMMKYFDTNISWDELALSSDTLTRDMARFDARLTRSRVLATEEYNEKRLVHLTTTRGYLTQLWSLGHEMVTDYR